MSIADFMSTGLITLSMDDDLGKAKTIFDQHKIHHILVTDDKELVGIFTDRDLYKHLSPAIGTYKETHKDTAYLQKKIHLIMSRDLITCDASLPLNEAVVLFYDNHISCLPVVDKHHRPVGIITWRDIIKILAQQHKKRSE
ncbi:CBS domain-containing protein [Thalassomonas viridans]|uniref:CBS domain-containing protein n=1 Tax=Thalassomonas viridans TaxID=137584 RepID=A0AAF0C670_9GAMM|nr:CBS domain-containing protein [Thalassomonas viridans]WDE04062.1 CBS domain-containing protein [Thalassomonas viridans]